MWGGRGWGRWVARTGPEWGAEGGVASPAQAAVQVAPGAFGKPWTRAVDVLAEFRGLALGFLRCCDIFAEIREAMIAPGQGRWKVLCVLHGAEVTRVQCSTSVLLLGSSYS